MPELPEVETIRRQLSRELKNQRIKGLEVRLPKMIKGPVALFKKKILKAKITAVTRRAKVLVIELSNGQTILIHLKMTGQLVYKKKTTLKVGGHPIKNGMQGLPNKFSHVIFKFSGGGILYFNDQRQFGYLRIVKSKEVEQIFSKSKLGPEPLSESFTQKFFKELLLKRKKAKIKQLLMDQTFIAGLGNIYATEVCYYAQVKPTRQAGSLNSKEAAKLFKAIKSILRSAIKKQGSSSNTYVDAYGQSGSYVPLLKIYGRAGELCPRCRSIIKTISLGGRGTAFCPKCQR